MFQNSSDLARTCGRDMRTWEVHATLSFIFSGPHFTCWSALYSLCTWDVTKRCLDSRIVDIVETPTKYGGELCQHHFYALVFGDICSMSCGAHGMCVHHPWCTMHRGNRHPDVVLNCAQCAPHIAHNFLDQFSKCMWNNCVIGEQGPPS